MYFSSKRDMSFFIIFWIVILFPIYLIIMDVDPGGFQLISYDSLLGYVVVGLIDAFLVWIWFRTGYMVEDGLVKVRFGPIRRTIRIAEIKKIRATRSLFSSPALAIDRLEILYGGQFHVVQISPERKVEFARILQAENPGIEVDLGEG